MSWRVVGTRQTAAVPRDEKGDIIIYSCRRACKFWKSGYLAWGKAVWTLFSTDHDLMTDFVWSHYGGCNKLTPLRNLFDNSQGLHWPSVSFASRSKVLIFCFCSTSHSSIHSGKAVQNRMPRMCWRILLIYFELWVMIFNFVLILILYVKHR